MGGYPQWISGMFKIKLPLVLPEAAGQQQSLLYLELSRFSPRSLSGDLEHPNKKKDDIG